MGQVITHAKAIQRRSRNHMVHQIRPNWFKVTDAVSGRTYDVNLGLNGGTCTCAWGQHRPYKDHRSGCIHVVAAMDARAGQHGRRISVWSSEKAAQRQHRPVVAIGNGLFLTSRMN